jgi:hypothetical protein
MSDCLFPWSTPSGPPTPSLAGEPRLLRPNRQQLELRPADLDGHLVDRLVHDGDVARPVGVLVDDVPSEVAARKKANITLDAPLTEGEIAGRQAEKDRTLAEIGVAAKLEPVVTPVVQVTDKATADVPALIAQFVKQGAAPQIDAHAAERAEAERIARPKVSEARALETKHGILKRQYLDRVEQAFNTDWPKFLAAVREEVIWDPASNRSVSANHRHIHRYRATAELARAGLTSTFGEQQGKEVLKALSLGFAAQQVESALDHDRHHVSDTARDGGRIRVLAMDFKAGVDALEWWLVKIRALVAETEKACASFLDAEKLLREMLVRVGTAQPAADTNKYTIPLLPAQPTPVGGSSYQDFDPRTV